MRNWDGAWRAAGVVAMVGLAVACSSSSGGSSSGSGPSDSGGYPGMTVCVTRPPGGSRQCSAPMDAAMCTQNGGTSAPTCPTDALVGCCQYNGNGGFICYYDSSSASAGESQCTTTHGKWTTTVPTF